MAERLRRYVQVVVNFVGVGSSPTECSYFFQKGNCIYQTKGKNGGTGIRARVKRITTAYANHYTIPPVLILSEIWPIQYKHALIAQLGER